ncbi:D-alanine--D-alanine ligase family protein [Treponema sp. Marseille-Q3903]|uniref:D-alanine--D-alanine ligase family protein n=1 Tax=Treponema sp. Marseille-Q3903 TaxID=2766703 RepID=UPI001651C308|nr:D-alanine--D-alanine ligase family protein [Treponema sp. Marseille-Q3903]MBC6714077.1 D-alanine--D-alanine ligase [Treponema sp. Marseille-Q3903]
MNICVIYGGRSGEHEVSLVTAAAITRGIDKSNRVILIGITKNGKWYLQEDSEYERICKDDKASFVIKTDESKIVSLVPGAKKASFVVEGKPLNVDVVFPALHGTYGEDGTIQGLFEMADIPYVGCSHTASAITMDKEKTKMIWQSVGLPVVPYVCIKRCVVLDSVVYDAVIEDTEKELGYPMFVKPCCAGSSNGASKASNRKELSFAIMEAFEWDDKVLIEKSINAREIECSVTGNSVTYPADSDIEDVVAYIPGEIIPTHTFYDFDAKYNDPDGAEFLIPAALSENDLEKIRKTACAAYKVLDTTGLARVDFFIERNTKQVYLNEINTMPGFTPISMFPKLCDAAGLKFNALIKLLIEEAIARYEAKCKLVTNRT